MKQHELATDMLRCYGGALGDCISPQSFGNFLSVTPGKVTSAITYLLAHKLIRHHKRGCYQITDAGKVTAEIQGGVVKRKTGVANAATQQQTSGADGIRGAAWRALRISPNLTMADILSRVDSGDTPNAKARIQRYFAGLVAVNVIARKGKAYLLINDLGPVAPTVGQRGQVFDPNAGVFVERVKQ